MNNVFCKILQNTDRNKTILVYGSATKVEISGSVHEKQYGKMAFKDIYCNLNLQT